MLGNHGLESGYRSGTCLGFGIWDLGFGWGCQLKCCGDSLNTHRLFWYQIWICCTLPAPSCVSSPHRQAKNPGQFALWPDRLFGVSWRWILFQESDQTKIIPIKKCHWASRTASAHYTQNRPTTKFSLPYVLLMAESLPWSLEWFNGVKVVW